MAPLCKGTQPPGWAKELPFTQLLTDLQIPEVHRHLLQVTFTFPQTPAVALRNSACPPSLRHGAGAPSPAPVSWKVPSHVPPRARPCRGRRGTAGAGAGEDHCKAPSPSSRLHPHGTGCRAGE